jgi:Glycosyltransferase family 87
MYNANYPPSALFLAVPFALLPWQPAHLLWVTLSAGIVVLAAFLIADLCAPYSPFLVVSLMGFFIGTSIILIMLAQPAMLSIGLCVIAAWCLIRDRFPILAVLSFAFSLTLKPQIAALIWLYFLLSGLPRYRRSAMQAFFVTILLCLPGILWASFMPQSRHWMHDLYVNLAGAAAHGNASDPGPANSEALGIASFQSVLSMVRDDPNFYNPATWAFIGTLLLLWLYPTLRMRHSLKEDFLALATIACLSLLPIYHREYDTRLLLLTFPALALLVSEGGVGIFAVVLSAIAFVAMSIPFARFVNIHYAAHHPHPGVAMTLVLMRDVPLAVLALGAFYLICYLQAFFKSRQSLALETSHFDESLSLKPTGRHPVHAE